MKQHIASALSATMLWTAPLMAALPRENRQSAEYAITIDAALPDEAEVQLRVGFPAERLVPARGGSTSAARNVRCADGRAAASVGGAWRVPSACTDIRWTVKLQDLEKSGVDASLPRSMFSRQHRYWLIVERDALLRASDTGGSVTLRLTAKGKDVAARSLLFPSIGEPPFIGAVAEKEFEPIRRDGIEVRRFGPTPQYGWFGKIDEQVLSMWARWRRDLGYQNAPRRID